jgi:exosortase/archaeosortase family protein
MSVPRDLIQEPPGSDVSRLVSPARGLLAVGLWAATVAAIASATSARAVEAEVAASLAGPVTSGRSGSVGDVILIGLGTPASMGLQITNECTVMLLIVPMLFLAGLIILFPRFKIRNVLFGLLMGVLVVGLTNQVRIVLIAWATENYGFGLGYELTHKFIGSVLAIAGFAAGLLLMLRLVPGRRAGKRS